MSTLVGRLSRESRGPSSSSALGRKASISSRIGAAGPTTETPPPVSSAVVVSVDKEGVAAFEKAVYALEKGVSALMKGVFGLEKGVFAVEKGRVLGLETGVL